MPISNDNQDYGKSDKTNETSNSATNKKGEFSSDDLKGKQQVDADVDKEEDKAADQQK